MNTQAPQGADASLPHNSPSADPPPAGLPPADLPSTGAPGPGSPRPGSARDQSLRHVFLRDLVLSASIGIYPHEHAARQRVRINVDLCVPDDGPPVGRDELSRVVDYEKVADAVRAIVASGHVRLVETLAERIAASCLTDPRVQLVRIRVEKLDIFPDAVSAGVEIERSRRDLSTP
jgi:7,8-dihydroneopterin aldolase/epimerase/oxygenase